MHSFGIFSWCILVAEKVIGRKFDVTEYGVCFIEDVLDDIPESVMQVSLSVVHLSRQYSSKAAMFCFCCFLSVRFVLAASLLKRE